MDEQTGSAKLRDVLANLYTTESDIYRALDDAGIDKRKIEFENPINTWHKAIQEAERGGRLEVLVRNAFKEYSSQPMLELFDGFVAYLESQRADVTSLAPTKPPISKAEEIGIEWVKIPAGEFLYGEEKETVYLDEFYISKTPVTNEQYKVYVDETEYDMPSYWKNGKIPVGKENHPVTHVSWFNAQSFCKWLGALLPTERQWEKAARGTDGREYPWGNEKPNGYYCNFNDNVRDTTQVDRYLLGASPYSILDMAGNVSEWCEDWFDNEQCYRVLRGGSWLHGSDEVGCGARYWDGPAYLGGSDGFRIVLPSIESATWVWK